jgi:hypothetical protein
MADWNLPVWRLIGLSGAIAFAVLVAMVLVGRSWLSSRDRAKAERAIPLIAGLGGARAGRQAQAELSAKHWD